MRPFITLGLALMLTLLLTACSTDSLLERGADLLDQFFAGDSSGSRLTIAQEPTPAGPQPEPQEPAKEPAQEPAQPPDEPAAEPQLPAQEPPPETPAQPAGEIAPSYTDATFFGPGESFLYIPTGISGAYACTYATEDEDVASVDQATGRVTAVGPGTTKVTMHVEYNGQYDFECIVRCNWQDDKKDASPPAEPALPSEPEKPAEKPAVKPAEKPVESAGPLGITASHTDATFFGPREKFRLRPIGVDDGVGVTYTTADPDVASVDINGNVTAIGPGTTTVTMTVDGGGTDYIFECIVRCKWSTESE